MTNPLETLTKIAEQEGVGQETIRVLVEEAGIKPTYERGRLRLYSQEEVGKVIAEHKAAVAQKQAAKAEKAQKVDERAKGYAGTELLHGLSRAACDLLETTGSTRQELASSFGLMQARIDDLEESLAASFKLATEQNAALLRAIQALQADRQERVSGSASNVAAMPHTQTVYSGHDQAPAPDEPRKRQPIVAVLGLTQAQFGEIKREFGDSLDLRHWESNDIRRPNFSASVKSADAVVAMVKFIGHDAMHKLRAANVKAVPVNGGMSTLRTELTRIFVESAEAA